MALIMPPEWAPQDWIWIGFPHDAEEWPFCLDRARKQIAAFASAVAESGQSVRLIVRDEANVALARKLCSARVTIQIFPFGDIWLRDTGPLVLQDIHDPTHQEALRCRFNGWGGKYLMEGDQQIGALLAKDAGLQIRRSDWILEGGAIDGDGTGLVVTTEQCLLNPNRNPDLSRADIEKRMARDLGFDRILWLGDGLVNDHTDGHVDNLARFVAPGTLALPRAQGSDDPNAAIYADALRRAAAFGLKICDIPSPGRIERNGMIEPASYANFVITSRLVVVPTFGVAADSEAVETLAALFPDRDVIGLRADAVLAGGGGFHCASQQMPRPG
ncbi:MAG: agmatine deiminase family protein [Sphingomonadaceae bacterium]